MERSQRSFARVLILVGFLGAVAVAFLAVWRPPNIASINQRKVVKFLVHAQPVFSGTLPFRIEGVRLSNELLLQPGRELITTGYRLVANCNSSSFTIFAMPVDPGKTGLFSFFRDASGMLHFEPEIGKPASSNSRPY
jgi:hypothetical protein